MPVKELPQLRLIERIDVTEDLLILRFEPESGGPFVREGGKDGKWNFLPGQFITLGLPGPEKQIERAYSIASSPYDPHFEFFIEIVKAGQLTPRLAALKPGERVSCRKATGRFVLDNNWTHHLQVGTVTGLAPFVSTLKACRTERKSGGPAATRRFLVLYGASHARELAYSDLLRECHAEGFVAFVPTISRPWDNPGWTGETGRCEEILRKHIDAHGFTHERTCAYLCGNGDMIRNAEGVLKRARFEPGQVKKEEYW